MSLDFPPNCIDYSFEYYTRSVKSNCKFTKFSLNDNIICFEILINLDKLRFRLHFYTK